MACMGRLTTFPPLTLNPTDSRRIHLPEIISIMKLKTIPSLFTAGTILAGFTWVMAAQPATNQPAASEPHATQGMMGVPSPMSETGSHKGSKMMDGQGTGKNGGMMQKMMQMSEMNPQMMKQGRMMMHTAISPTDPAAIIGQKEQFNLTDDQVAKLQAIAKNARNDARSILDEAQRTQLDALPAGPGSMAQMHKQMMVHMQQMQGQSAMPSCPMMTMMMRDTDGTEEHPTKTSDTPHSSHTH